MLVLSRKIAKVANKSGKAVIYIGENIKITLIDTKGDHAKIGIDAPRNVKILRGELRTPPESDQQKEAA